MATREFDFIIFGATGFTGRYVIEELCKSEQSCDIKWAIAGRNIQKLQESLDIVQKYLGNVPDIKRTTIIQADVEDIESISKMCKRSKLVLNCVGPYNLYGEVVVAACIENGTHHVDLGAEIKYLEEIQAKYFKTAREKGVYIVEACGFGSIPGDYGTSLLKCEFPGDLNSVVYFLEIIQGPSGRTTSIGTFLSAIFSIGDLSNAKKYHDLLKENVFKKEFVKSNYPLHKRFPLFVYSKEVNGWCHGCMGPVDRVIKRSQKFRYEYLNERFIQTRGYLRMHSFIIALCYAFFAGLFRCMILFSWGRCLLVKYPSFFTAGVFSTNGPTRQQVLEGTSRITLYGSGWKNKLPEPTDQHTIEPDTKIKLTISGPEPAYPLTAMCMVQAAFVILQEKDKLPLEGGVLTPGIAFENTSLRQRLEKRGMTFTFEKLN